MMFTKDFSFRKVGLYILHFEILYLPLDLEGSVIVANAWSVVCPFI